MSASSQAWYTRYYAPYRVAFGWMTLHYIMKSACVWLSPIIMARLIDVASSQDPHRFAWAAFWAGLQFALVILNFPTALSSMRHLSALSRGLSRDLRLKVCQKIHELSYLQQESYRSGRLQSKAIHDIDTLEQFPRIFLNQILGTALSLSIILVSILIRAPKALLVFATLIPIGVFLRMHYLDKIQSSSTAYRQSFERMAMSLHNILSMNLITKAHGLENFAVKQLQPQIAGVCEKGQDFDMSSERLGASSFVSFTLIQVLFLFISVYASMRGEITVGDIVMFNAFFASISGSLMGLVNIFPAMSQMREAAHSLDELLALPIEPEDQGLSLPQIEGQLEFSDVSFQYPQADRPALSHISFVAKPGSPIAFVGPSGCGKTTILSLILGFFRPTSGRILLVGKDLTSLKLTDYRSQIGVVTQDTLLLAGSIWENVAYGLPDLTEEEIKEALRQAEALDFVLSLPEGLHTRLGDEGLKLSGGQKQRLALARALVRNPKILVLDEATSAVDIAIEERLQETLQRIMQDRTTFIVSHRAPSVIHCDTIIVLDHGQVTARGRHWELLGSSSFYRQLVGPLRSHTNSPSQGFT